VNRREHQPTPVEQPEPSRGEQLVTSLTESYKRHRAAGRLIADRGHGPSRPQKEALRWLATEGRDGISPRSVATWDSLRRAGLVTHRPGTGEMAGWELTDDGRCLTGRMIRLPGGGEHQ